MSTVHLYSMKYRLSHRLSLLDRRDMFKWSKSSSSNNIEEDDMDKIFNHYIERRATNGEAIRYSANEGLVASAQGEHSKPSNHHFLSFIFRRGGSAKNANRSSIRSKFKLLSVRSKDNSRNLKSSPEPVATGTVKKASLNSNFKYDLHNLNLNELEKDFHKANGRKRTDKSDSIMSNHSIYLDANLVVSSRIKKSRSTLPDLKSESTSHFLFKNSNKAVLGAFVDVSIEKLQQSLNGHTMSISLKNLRTEPLIEINYIKAKLNYLSIELVESKNGEQQHGSGGPLMAKINKLKTKKCKFEHNLKSFSKPVDFDLVNEHFMAVTDEAMQQQMRKVVLKAAGQQSTCDTLDEEQSRRQPSVETAANPTSASESKRTFLFLFSVEIHSYLPVSRKILSSTFRKKKRIFKGQCQIHENFVQQTQFTKQFLLNEI